MHVPHDASLMMSVVVGVCGCRDLPGDVSAALFTHLALLSMTALSVWTHGVEQRASPAGCLACTMGACFHLASLSVTYGCLGAEGQATSVPGRLAFVHYGRLYEALASQLVDEPPTLLAYTLLHGCRSFQASTSVCMEALTSWRRIHAAARLQLLPSALVLEWVRCFNQGYNQG